MAANGTFYISDVNSGAVAVMKNDQIVDVIKVEGRPHGLAVDPMTGDVYTSSTVATRLCRRERRVGRGFTGGHAREPQRRRVRPTRDRRSQQHRRRCSPCCEQELAVLSLKVRQCVHGPSLALQDLQADVHGSHRNDLRGVALAAPCVGVRALESMQPSRGQTATH